MDANKHLSRGYTQTINWYSRSDVILIIVIPAALMVRDGEQLAEKQNKRLASGQHELDLVTYLAKKSKAERLHSQY